MYKRKLIILAGLLAGSVVSSAILAADKITIEQLLSIIEQQQKQLEAQASTLEALRQKVDALSRERATTGTPSTTAVDTTAADTADTETTEAETIIEDTAVAAKDEPATVRPGEARVNLTISGQVNRGLLHIDDGERTELFNVDNQNSSTRVRLIGEAKPTENITFGTNIEVQFESNSTGEVNQEEQRNVGPNHFTQRRLELYVDSTHFGRVMLGQGHTASDGTSEVDFSSTSVVGYSGVADMAGGILFRDKDSGELTDIRVKDGFSNFDGLGRDDRIRYDTHSFGGVKLATSYIADDRWDVALRFGGQFGALKTAAAIAYADPNDDDRDNRINGSASMLHDSGFNLTAAAGRDDRDDRDPKFWYVKAGYQTTDWVSWGETALAIDYFRGDDINESGDKSKAYGVLAVQKIDNWGVEFYLGLRNYEFDPIDVNLDNILALLAGARVKF